MLSKAGLLRTGHGVKEALEKIAESEGYTKRGKYGSLPVKGGV